MCKFKFNSRKGFFFVVTSLILLTYILTNLALWSKSVSIQEDRYSENFKISNLDYAASQVTESKMIEFSKIAVDYALYKLNEKSIEYPLKKGDTGKWKYENINSSIHGLITEGIAGPGNFTGADESGKTLTYNSEEKEGYTFGAFFEKLDESFAAISLSVVNPKLEDFYFNQSSYDKIHVSFNLSFDVEDLDKQASINRDMEIEFEISIQGLTDPAIARKMKENYNGNQHVEKQIFFREDNFNAYEDLKVNKIGETGKGQGWFYGNIYQNGSGEEPPDQLKFLYALKGSPEDIVQVSDHGYYGAYFVVGEYSFQEARHILGKEKPIFIGDSDNTITCPNPLASMPGTTDCIFFVSSYDKGEIPDEDLAIDPIAEAYNIENFRDFVSCSYYFTTKEGDTNTYEGPSYFQRLLSDSFNDVPDEWDLKYGIATFLVWEGIEDGASDSNSRLDIEFFKNYDGDILRGTPGCKFFEMCSVEDSYVGRFKLSKTAIETFLGENAYINCEDGHWAECGN